MLRKIENIDVALTQKKMFKQFFYLIIFIIFAFLLSFFTDDVFAVDYGYDRYTSSNYYYTYIINDLEGYCNNEEFMTSDIVYYGSLITGSDDFDLDAKTNYLNGDLKTDYIQRFILRAYGSDDYIYSKDNVYTLRYTFNFRYVQNNDTSLHDDFLNYLQNNYQVTTVYGNTSPTITDMSTSNIDNYSYYWKEGSAEGRYLLYIIIKPSTDLKFISAVVKPNTDTYNINKLVYGSYNVSYLKITYSEGMNAVIEQQTIVIQQKFEEMFNILKDNTDDTLNADADSSFNGNGDKFDNYNESENELKNSVDVDISSLDFEVDNYQSSFGFVWDNVINFLNANIKVFNMVIGVLTLSFVGLVIGRL